MNKVTFVGMTACLVVMAAGCNINSPANEPYGSSLTNSQGSFSETKQVAAAETPLHADCSTTGGVIDSRLKSGDVYESTYKSINGFKVSKLLTTRARITSVDKANLKEGVMPLSASGFTVTLSQEEPLNCTYDAKGNSTCTQPSFVSAVAAETSGQYSGCQISGKGSDVINQRSAIGKFKLVIGQTVDAYLITRLVQGDLVCSGKTVSTGDHLESFILSNNVPAEGSGSACGGTILFRSDSYRNNHKRVMFGSSFERTVIPN